MTLGFDSTHDMRAAGDGRRAGECTGCNTTARTSALYVLLFLFVCGGCASRPSKVDLMPAPAVFAGGDINPAPVGTPPVTEDGIRIYYATDRKPSDDFENWPFYEDRAGLLVRLGRGTVTSDQHGLGWDEVRRITLSSERRPGDYQIRLASVEETGTLASTYTLLSRAPPPAASDDTGKAFAGAVNERLTDTGGKDIYIYVHGFRVVFDDPLIISSEFWHFLGYRGAFIAYSWPSTPRALAYFSDLETAHAMARKLRLFLSFLAEQTDVERIHIIAYSAGSRLVSGALEQLALLHSGDTPEEIREKLRIGSVIYVGADMSREQFGVGLTDGTLRVAERTVVYVSSTDVALRWARRIFRRPRLGQMWDVAPSSRVAEFLRANPSLELVDVTGSAGSTTGKGHDFFRQSPWVSSDLLALLAFELDARGRGLVLDNDLLVWRFPPDYIERLRGNILERYPNVTERLGEPVGRSDDE